MTERNRDRYIFTNFRGVDYAHTTAEVSAERSVNGLNMVRSEVGKVRKRTGYEVDEKVWDGNINGVHFLKRNSGDICLIHCGNSFYIGETKIYDMAADSFSRSVQMGDVLYILDSRHFLMFDGNKVQTVAENAFIPLIYTNRKPEGGGKRKQQVNILTNKRTEGFIADGESKTYVLSEAYINDAYVYAYIYRDDGTSYKASTTDGLTVDCKNGTVTFDTAPPLSKFADRDNVYVTYEKGEAAGTVLDKCTVMAVFGAGGKPDTLFLSGNPDYPGREWFSQPEKPEFFGVNNTDVALDNGCSITGYSVKGDKLFVHRKNGGRDLNVLVRMCSGGDAENYSYPVVNALSGPGSDAEDSFVNMASDAMFLSEKGIYAITETEADEKHYTQLRSFYINPLLLESVKQGDVKAAGYNDFYVLAAGNDIFLLDTLQKSYEEDKEYSRYQYECYHWRIPEKVRLLFVEDDRLCFADEKGRICRFYNNYERPESYNDDGQSISAVWQTGDFFGDSKYTVKNIHRLWIVCEPANHTGVTVSTQVKGIWQRLFEDTTSARFFQWSRLNWAKFTWSADRTARLISRTVRVRNVDKTALKLENNILNEPFGIYEVGIEFTEGSFYRGG